MDVGFQILVGIVLWPVMLTVAHRMAVCDEVQGSCMRVPPTVVIQQEDVAATVASLVGSYMMAKTASAWAEPSCAAGCGPP